MAEGAPQNDQPAGVFELPIGNCSAGGELSTLQLDSIVMPSTPEGRQTALESVSNRSALSDAGEDTRQALSDLINGGKIARFDEGHLSVPCMTTLLKNDAVNHSGIQKLAAGQADLFLDKQIKAA